MCIVVHVPRKLKVVHEEQFVLTLSKEQAQAVRALAGHVISDELNTLGLSELLCLPRGTTAVDTNAGKGAEFAIGGRYLPAFRFEPV